MKLRIIVATVLLLSNGTILAVPTVSIGSMEEREKGTPRSSVYKGEGVWHEENKLIMKDSNGHALDLHLGQDTVIQGRTFQARAGRPRSINSPNEVGMQGPSDYVQLSNAFPEYQTTISH